MKGKILLFMGFLIFFASLASAEIIIDKQPKESYNLGETIDFSMTITSANGVYDFLKTSLNCKNHIHGLPSEEVSIAANEVMKIDKSIFLIEKFIGNALGDCNIKAWLEDSSGDIVFSDNFKILNLIEFELGIPITEFNPGEEIEVKGMATKNNQELVNGFIELNLPLTNSSENKTYQGVIENGEFSMNFLLPEDMAAGEYSLIINAYEKDPLEATTNKGATHFNININQVPTNLEIFFENQEVIPGGNLKVKAILRDQTGQQINANTVISIKDDGNKVLEQLEKPTDEFLEYPIAYNEPPAEWTVVAISTKLSSEAGFNIAEKADIKVDIINNTLIITNIGNVPYTKPVIVRIGEENVDMNLSLGVDEIKIYSLSAPNGEYEIEVITEGESKIEENTELTGKAISVKESSNAIILTKYPLVWLFIIFILGFFAFVVFKKGYKKNFVGYIKSKGKESREVFSGSGIKGNLIGTNNRAELSLSISGEKQKVSVVCINIKNFREIKNPGDIKETLEKIKTAAEESKAFVYENNGNIFFIFSPVITKTFDNEKSALFLAQKIKKIIEENNRIFRQKISFGISLNHGEIISRKEGDVLKFMGFGNLIINSRKIASVSDSEIYIDEKMRDKISPYTRLEKKSIQGMDIFTIKEMRNQRSHGKFITEFVKRIEKTNSEEKVKKEDERKSEQEEPEEERKEGSGEGKER